MEETQGRAGAGSQPDLGFPEVTWLLLPDEVSVASPIPLISEYCTQKSLPRTCRKQALGTQVLGRWVGLSQPQWVVWQKLCSQEELEGVSTGWGWVGPGTSRLTRGLGFGSEMPWFLRPGCSVSSHAPVAPRPNLIVLGSHLDDVLLPSVGICDGVCCAIRELHLQAQSRDGVKVSPQPHKGSKDTPGERDTNVSLEGVMALLWGEAHSE